MKNLMKYINYIIIACAALAVVMIFLPAVKFEFLGMSESYNGLKVAFGGDGFKFSILNCLTIVAVVAALVCGILLMKSNNKTVLIVEIACAAVAVLLFFLTKNFLQFSDISGAEAKEMKKMFDLGIGAILGGIFSLLACVAGVLKLVFDKE